jgi:hypothetical protein
MIMINLLPHELRPIKRTPLPYIGGVALLIAALVAVAVMFLGMESKIKTVNTEINKCKAEFSKTTDIKGEDGKPITLEQVVDKYEQLFERKDLLELRVSIIKEILSDRIIWSEQLQRLTKLTPDNMWYRRIRVIWQDFKEQQIKKNPKTGEPELDKKTKQPMLETKTVKKPILEVSGYVIPDEKGSVETNKLFTQLDTDPEFKKQFTDGLPAFNDTTFNNFTVREFTIQFRIKSGEKSE